jgi:hypothetical protein
MSIAPSTHHRAGAQVRDAPKVHKRRALVTAFALVLPASAAAPMLASAPADASQPAAAVQAAYCIPPATPRAAAAQNANETATVLSGTTEGALTATGSLGVPVGASSAGTVKVRLTRWGWATTVGVGKATVAAAGCSQLSIALTAAGERLLKAGEASKVPLELLVTSRFIPVPGSGRAATARVVATLNP